MRRALYASLTAIIVVFCGCGSGNDSATVLEASGKHPSGWVVQANGGEHPKLYFSQPESCVQCHGSDLKGGTSKVSCFSADYNGFSCHPYGLGHAPEWAAAGQHGAKAKAPVGGNNGMGFCRNCHGPDYNGAGQSPSCLNCHGGPSPHPQAAQWRSAASPPQVPYTHSNTDASNAQACSQCHNATTKNLAQPYQARFVPAGSFNGSAPGCYNGSMCHADIVKTANCDVCHGLLASGVFNSLSGITIPTNTKVGAHSKHFASTISSSIACQQCHPMPPSYTQSGLHRDGTTNFAFGKLATYSGALSPSVVLSAAGYTCTNNYCHGVTIGGGSNKIPRWNDTGYNTGCATCHGYPPPVPHPQIINCNGCHPEVNSTNNGFTPNGVSLHINGKVEAGHVFPYPGALHSTAGAVRANCSGIACHDTTTAGGSYPVSPGVPPFCSGCHLNMTTFLGANPGCWDCHGASATDGRPDSTPNSFPNRRASHQEGDHDISANNCTTCHPYSAGSTSHGWSNRTKSTFAQVLTSLTWVPGSRSNSGTCATAGCHGTDKSPWYP